MKDFLLYKYRYFYYYLYLTWSTTLRKSDTARLDAVFTISLTILFLMGGMVMVLDQHTPLSQVAWFNSNLHLIGLSFFTLINIVNWMMMGRISEHTKIVGQFKNKSSREITKGKLIVWSVFFLALFLLFIV